jgi:hypothetical protein
MPPLNADQRVHAHIQEWAERTGHGAATMLSKAVSGKYGEDMSVQWASGIINGNPLRLKYLDAVAELLGVPPGDLVRRHEDHYLEVTYSEMRFLKHLRTLPDTVRQHLLQVYEYIFGFQERLLKEQKAIVDGRTKAARLERQRQRRLAGE